MVSTNVLVLCFALSSTLGGTFGEALGQDTTKACEEKLSCDSDNRKCRDAVAASLAELQTDLTSMHRDDIRVRESTESFINQKERKRAVGKLRRKKKFRDGLKSIQDTFCKYHRIAHCIIKALQESASPGSMGALAAAPAKILKTICALEMITDSHCPKSKIPNLANINKNNVTRNLAMLNIEMIDFVNKTSSALKRQGKPKKRRRGKKKGRRRKSRKTGKRRRKSRSKRRSRNKKRSKKKSSSLGREASKAVSTTRVYSPNTFIPSTPIATVRRNGEKRKRSRSLRRRTTSKDPRSTVNSACQTSACITVSPRRVRKKSKQTRKNG